ncbi:MAG: heavy metal-responsive transcriptional regulator [Actinomycetota bacterium]
MDDTEATRHEPPTLPPEGNVGTETRMRIGELGKRLAVNPKTIRYYEGIGLLPQPERTASGYRTYDEEDVERLTFIKAAQRLGITLDEIREILAFRERGERPCKYVRRVLRREVAEIDQRLADLTALRDELVALERMADQLPESRPGTCGLIDHVRQRQGALPT